MTEVDFATLTEEQVCDLHAVLAEVQVKEAEDARRKR